MNRLEKTAKLKDTENDSVEPISLPQSQNPYVRMFIGISSIDFGAKPKFIPQIFMQKFDPFYRITHLTFQLASDRQIFLSYWQRPLLVQDYLRSKPLWSLEETGLKNKLEKVQNKWKTILNEALDVLEIKGNFSEVSFLQIGKAEFERYLCF